MNVLNRIYDALIMALAIVAGAMVAGVFVSIVVDVIMRTAGLQPPMWTSALTEYALLYMTMLAAPWMVRNGGHVFVESFTSMMPPAWLGVVERLVYAMCIAICLVLAWYAASLGYDVYLRDEQDYRSIVSPRWVLFASLPVGFGLSAVEFARFLLGRGTMYKERSARMESI